MEVLSILHRNDGSSLHCAVFTLQCQKKRRKRFETHVSSIFAYLSVTRRKRRMWERLLVAVGFDTVMKWVFRAVSVLQLIFFLRAALIILLQEKKKRLLACCYFKHKVLCSNFFFPLRYIQSTYKLESIFLKGNSLTAHINFQAI